MKKRLIYFIASIALLIIEILIGLYAHGWIRNYLGDVLVVILLYTLFRTVSPEWPGKWYILPTVILVFSFEVEFLQLWGFCDRFGITNRLLRIIIGTGFSLIDLLCYAVGILPCYVTEYITKEIRKNKKWEAVHSEEFKRFYRAVGNSYEYAYTEFYPESFDKIYEWERDELEDFIWNRYLRGTIKFARILPYLKKYDGAGKLREDLLSPDTPEGWKKEISFALDNFKGGTKS